MRRVRGLLSTIGGERASRRLATVGVQNRTPEANLIGIGCVPTWCLARTAKKWRPKTSRRTRSACASPTPSSSGPACLPTRSVGGKNPSLDSSRSGAAIRHDQEDEARPAARAISASYGCERLLDVDLEVAPLHPCHEDAWKPSSAASGVALVPIHVTAPGQPFWIRPRKQACERVKARRIEGLTHSRSQLFGAHRLAARPTGPAAAEASPPEREHVGQRFPSQVDQDRMTWSLEDPPIWKPTLPPSMRPCPAPTSLRRSCCGTTGSLCRISRPERRGLEIRDDHDASAFSRSSSGMPLSGAAMISEHRRCHAETLTASSLSDATNGAGPELSPRSLP